MFVYARWTSYVFDSVRPQKTNTYYVRLSHDYRSTNPFYQDGEKSLWINYDYEARKLKIKEKLSSKEEAKCYGQCKIDVELILGLTKANLGFTRFSVRGQSKDKNEKRPGKFITN